MDDQKMNRAIKLHDEIVLLRDILKAADMQPYLTFYFLSIPGRVDDNFTIKNEALVYEILRIIQDRKADLEKEYEAL